MAKMYDPGYGVGLNLPQPPSTHFNKIAFEASRPADSEDHFYSERQWQILKYAAKKRYIKVSGFSFCSMLDASSFDSLAPIRDLDGSLASVNPDLNEFINLIDGKAYDIFKGLMKKFHLAHQSEANRLACYIAAEGQSAVANMTFSRLLNEINPKNYFKHIIPAIVPARVTSMKRNFKLAYLIMVHELHGFAQLCNLLKILDDGGAIILIHVDARVQSSELYDKIKTWTKKRSISNPDSAIFLAKKRFSNIWGHISLVYTQLSGFWELLDLANWDYVINLSNYDYPLKSNAEIHACLTRNGKKGKNYIEYWSETSDIAERLIRPVLGEADYSTVYHPPELGLISRPYTNWVSWKHHQWVILTPESIHFLRNDIRALNYLAFAEHTYIPDESYFGTVLLNSPEFQNSIVNNNKRYLRFTGGAHPSWLGYNDRHLFPSGESDPSFFFIRKFNSKGDMFKEQKLLEWIKNDHFNKFDTVSRRNCTIQMMSVQSSCLKEIADDIAYKNSIIVIPVNTAFIKIAKNLVCSLSRLGIKNVMYWALDLDIYETLLEEGKLAILLPGLNPMNGLQKSKSRILQKVLRSKPQLLEMFIRAGFSVWIMDGDMVALRDFRGVQDSNTNVFISHDNTDHLIGGPAIPSSSLMYFRFSNHSLTLLQKINAELENSSKIDDEEALRKVIRKQEGVEILSSDHTRMYEGEEPLKLETESSSNPITIRYLDGLRFMSSKIFLNNPSFIPKGFDDFYTLHFHGKNVEPVLKKHSLWFLDQDENCDIDSPDPILKFK